MGVMLKVGDEVVIYDEARARDQNLKAKGLTGVVVSLGVFGRTVEVYWEALGRRSDHWTEECPDRIRAQGLLRYGVKKLEEEGWD